MWGYKYLVGQPKRLTRADNRLLVQRHRHRKGGEVLKTGASADLHDPFHVMKDMEKAVERVEWAVANQEKIVVYGDYGVDGCTAVALVYKFLRQIGHKNLMFYIPDRYTEGYGISIGGIDLAARKGVGLSSPWTAASKPRKRLSMRRRKAWISSSATTTSGRGFPGRSRSGPQAGRLLLPFDELSGCGVGFKLVQAYAQKNRMPFEQILPCWTCWSYRSPRTSCRWSARTGFWPISA